MQVAAGQSFENNPSEDRFFGEHPAGGNGAANGTTNGTSAPPVKNHPLVNFLANSISYIFHPLFIPLYVGYFIIYKYPYFFSGYSDLGKVKVMLSLFVNMSFLPAMVVFLLWRLKFTKSIQVRTQKERLIPYAASIIFYFWVWYVFKTQPDTPPMLQIFLLGSFLAVCLDWMANIFYKISMHATAAGGMAACIALLAFSGEMAMGLYLSLAVLLAGLICSARLLLNGHTAFEVYTGFGAGVIAQVFAAWVVLG